MWENQTKSIANIRKLGKLFKDFSFPTGYYEFSSNLGPVLKFIVKYK